MQNWNFEFSILPACPYILAVAPRGCPRYNHAACKFPSYPWRSIAPGVVSCNPREIVRGKEVNRLDNEETTMVEEAVTDEPATQQPASEAVEPEPEPELDSTLHETTVAPSCVTATP